MRIMIMFNDEQLVQVETDFSEKPSSNSDECYKAGIAMFNNLFEKAVEMAYAKYISEGKHKVK